MFSRSQDKWEGDSNLTYPPVKLNGFRTTGPRRKPKVTLFILDSFINTQLFLLKIQQGSSFIDLLLLYKET